MSQITDIADGVVTTLNNAPGGTYSQSFTAVRKVLPVYELADLKNLTVTVVPKSVEITNITRDMSQYDMQVDIGIQKHLASGDNIDTVVNSLGDLVDEIIEYMRTKSPLAGVSWVEMKNDPVYSMEHLIEKRTFTSVITLAYKAMK